MNKVKTVLKEEFITGKKPFDFIFLGIGLLLQIAAIIYGFISGTPDSVEVMISGITGIISVVLCAQGKISFYVFGYIQLLTYVFGVAIPYALWGEVIENIYYFATMVYGTYIWFKNYGKSTNGEIKIKPKKLTKTGWVVYTSAFIVLTIVFAFFLKDAHILLPSIFPTADPTPVLDSITTIAPFLAQLLLMFGYREQWVFWIIEDIISVIMFISLGNTIMVAQYVFWTVNCIYGWIMWSDSKVINEEY